MKISALLPLFLLSMVPPAIARPEVVAHRGASATAPENTLAAFREAWKEKSDGIELDIWMSADDRIVVIHDRDTKRTTGIAGEVKDLTLQEIKKRDAGSWKGEKWRGETVPTLEESLAELPEGKTVYIEIKCGAEVLPGLKRAIDAVEKPEGIRVIAFNFETLAKAKELMPAVKMLWLVDGKKDAITGKKIYPEIAGLADKAASARLEGINLHHGFPLTEEAVAGIHAKGLSVAVWTVNDETAAKKMAAAGVDMIATDHPAKLRAWLGDAVE